MSRILFFVLAGAFCLAACLPLRSRSTDSWADLTVVVGSDCTGICYDRQFDFPTGDLYIDMPVWVVDAGFFASASIAFGFYASRKLQEQKV
jgi:hypothetical protein